jgi:hypothetical protein
MADNHWRQLTSRVGIADEADIPAWLARFMQGRKARIEAQAPTIDFDFESLAD